MTSELDTAILRQSEIGQEIERHFSNYNKDSKDRKQRVEYFKKRLDTLEALYNEFCQNDEAIRPLIDSDHAYVRQMYKTKIDNLCAKYKDMLEQQKMLLETSLAHSATLPSASIQASTSQLSNDHSRSNQPVNNPRAEEEIHQVKLQKVNMKSLERLLRSLQTDIEQDNPVAYLQPKFDACSKYYSEVASGHQALMCQTYMGDYKAEFFEVLEDQYFEVSAKLKTAVERHTISPSATSTGASYLKLPKIVIPTFDGNGRKWKQFQDMFEQMIHSKTNMSSIEKFYYLKSNLSGEASRLICHLLVTEENYLSAWDTLVNRYDNTRVLVSACLADLLATPALTSETHYGLKRFHDHTKECLLAVRNLGVDTRNWDSIILQILLPKLDAETRRLYELSLKNPRELQSVDEFYMFIELRFQSLEAAGNKAQQGNLARSSNRFTNKPSALLSRESHSNTCSKCKGSHKLYKCDTFARLSAIERLNHVNRFKLCTNCLSTGHRATSCPSRNCMKCPDKHHSILHEAFQQQQSLQPRPSSSPANAASLAAQTSQATQYVFLATALVTIMDKNNKPIRCRALLDSGSQLNFVTEKLARKLNLRSTTHQLDITGIGAQPSRTQKRINVELKSNVNAYTTRLEAFILPKITGDQPQYYIDTRSWNIPHNIQLADPAFNQPQSIDLLIGADIYCQLMSIGQFRLREDAPMLQNTLLGWVVLGKASNTITRTESMFCGISAHEEISLNEQLAKFWDIEEVGDSSKAMTTMELKCEAIFKETTARTKSGRFSVRLPFKPQEELGESKQVALQRFFSLEKRLLRHTSLRVEYTKFMREYEALHHMEEIQEADIPASHYFLPHHCVLKPESSTTKLRVVYDASAKTTNNKSLNDVLMTGPTIQDDLFSVLIRFRLHTYVFTADITKMYRQILVEDRDTWHQLIIWREGPTEPIKYYRLRTVTYGTTCASYLAIRCLQQLSEDGAEAFPLASHITKRDFYVDDVMTGTDDLAKAIEIQNQLKGLLGSAGFTLRKWCANHKKLLRNIDFQDREELATIEGSIEGGIKTLGLTWLPHTDQFKFQTVWPVRKQITKRTATSDTAHLFDPLGLVNPVITLAKIFIQELWKLKLDWDAALPLELHNKWARFRSELFKLQNVSIDRHALHVGERRHIQVHIFSDASEKAYGTTGIFTRAIHNVCPLPAVENSEHERLTEPAIEETADILAPSTENDNKPAHCVDETTTTDTKAQGRYKARKLSTAATTVLLLTSLILPVFTMDPIEVTSFNNTPGLYFENLGKVSLISDEWKLIVYYDMKTYWNEIDGLRGCIWALNKICEGMMTHKDHCDAVASYLSHQFEIIAHIDDIMLTGHAVNMGRAKRSPFDFIGSIANTLFGILDQGYAEQIEREIQRSQGNQNHILNLIKNQTSLIDATANILHKVEEDINHQFSQINDLINNITSQLNEQQDVAQAFNALATQTVAVATDCRNMQNTIIDLLTDTHHGRINPLLLTPDQLKAEVSVIRENLPPNTMIPGSHTNTELLTLYTLMKARGRLTLQYLIINIDLPLVNTERYDIFALTPFPMRYKDSLIFIKTAIKYLIVNIHQDSYFSLTEQQLSECISLDEATRVCNQQYPVFKRGSQAYQCETSLLFQENDISQCEVTETKLANWWTALHNKREWLFSVSQEILFTAVCEKTSIRKAISNDGILKLNSACVIRHPWFIIASTGNNTITLKPPVLTSNINQGFTIKRKQQINLHPLTMNNSADINSLKDAIQKIQQMEKLPAGPTIHDLHQYVVSYSSITLLVICVAIFMIWKCKTERQPPTPAPRRIHHPPSAAHSRDELFELQEMV